MKKIILAILVFLIHSNLSYANRLGIDEKTLDINFDCKIYPDALKSIGYPEKIINKIKTSASMSKRKIGFKKFLLLEKEQVLISLFYNQNEKKFIFPNSTVTQNLNSEENEFVSYQEGGGMIWEEKLTPIENNEYFLSHINYSVDDKNIQKFKKLRDHMNKLSDDGFVIKLKELTKEYQEYVPSKYNNPVLKLAYICTKN